MSIRKSLAMKSVQVSITAAILFLIVANPMLFMIVLVLHSIVFGLLMYLSTKYFFDDSYKWLEKNM